MNKPAPHHGPATTWWITLLLAVMVQVAAMAAAWGSLNSRVDALERQQISTLAKLDQVQPLATDLAVLKTELKSINDTLGRLEATLRNKR